MAVTSSGPISLQNLSNEFGPGSGAVALSSYYRGGGRVPNASQNNAVPTGGAIALSNFYGATNTTSGSASYTTPGVYTFIMPLCQSITLDIRAGGGASAYAYIDYLAQAGTYSEVGGYQAYGGGGAYGGRAAQGGYTSEGVEYPGDPGATPYNGADGSANAGYAGAGGGAGGSAFNHYSGGAGGRAYLTFGAGAFGGAGAAVTVVVGSGGSTPAYYSVAGGDGAVYIYWS